MAATHLMHRSAGGSRRRRGQILMITLLALLLLASMVFFVFNAGEQINRRMSMQNAADSAAIGGATWMARSMNVVAMNNVAQSRLIAMAALLDSLPLASQLTYEELDAIIKGLEAQQADPRLANDPRLAIVRNGINSMLNDRVGGNFPHPGLRLQRDRVAPVHQEMNLSGFDVRTLTYWDRGSGGAPNGRLWVGAKAMEDFNAATIDSARLLTQATAARMGNACITRIADGQADASVASSFLVPVYPELPAQLGTFLDFRPIVDSGVPPEKARVGSALAFAHRGPCDQLYHWRREHYDTSTARPAITQLVGTVTDPPTRGTPRNSNGQPGLSPNPPGASGGGTRNIYRTISPAVPGTQIGWDPYGIYDWALTMSTSWDANGFVRYPNSGMVDFTSQYLPDLPRGLIASGTAAQSPNFLTRMQKLSRTKLNYFWGDTAPKTIHHPDWRTTYTEAKNLAGQNLAQIKYTWLWIVRIRSSVAWGSPAYMADPNTYYPKPNAAQYDPYSCPVQNGWLDPGDPKNVQQFGAAQQVAEGVWMTDWTYQVDYDVDIGLLPPPPPPPNVNPPPAPVYHTVYVRDFFVFFGVDVGNEDTIRNPGNWAAGQTLPRPYLLDLSKAEYRTDGSDSYRNGTGSRYYLHYLGLARETSQANLWPARFTSANPYPNVIALAEAQVFNNQSWDLWTQDWQARLKPVQDYEYWTNQRMNADAADLSAVSQYVHESDLTAIREMLSKYPPDLVEKVSTH